MTLWPASIDTFVFRAPITRPVVTSFGTMTERPALLVRVRDRDGAEGWGEVWCNWPPRGAKHRACLVEDVAAPLLVGREFADPPEARRRLLAGLHIVALQTGETGPFAQVAAGLDIALWDLWARRRDEPVWQALGGRTPGALPVYASGINPAGAPDTVARCRAAGHRAFKIKVGLERDRDRANAETIAGMLEPGECFMLDANQGWDLEAALAEAPALARAGAAWIEEPLAADRPATEWQRLAARTPTPLAAGENMTDERDFDAAISGGWLGVVQPDVCKWGGLSGCRAMARRAMEAGKRYCPHYLGGGIGLLASAHLLAAVGGDGLLEVDVNANPLRERLAQPYPAIADGAMTLPDAPGLGVTPDPAEASRWQVGGTGRI